MTKAGTRNGHDIYYYDFDTSGYTSEDPFNEEKVNNILKSTFNCIISPISSCFIIM